MILGITINAPIQAADNVMLGNRTRVKFMGFGTVCFICCAAWLQEQIINSSDLSDRRDFTAIFWVLAALYAAAISRKVINNAQ